MPVENWHIIINSDVIIEVIMYSSDSNYFRWISLTQRYFLGTRIAGLSEDFWFSSTNLSIISLVSALHRLFPCISPLSVIKIQKPVNTARSNNNILWSVWQTFKYYWNHWATNRTSIIYLSQKTRYLKRYSTIEIQEISTL